ncbi:MAG: aminoglycoside phosphotransferase family protein [Chloroflexota bacterium]
MLIPAFNDKRLPRLREAANPERMLPAFRSYFKQTYPDRSEQLTDCFIDQIRYKPGRYSRYLYRLRVDNVDQWFIGQLPVQGKEPSVKKRQAWDELPLNGVWRALAFWDDFGMQLQTFPYDKNLTQVPALLDPKVVCSLAQAQAESFGLTDVWTCEDAVIQQVKYMPSKRCVLRYDFDWRGPAGERKQTAVYSKTYGKGDGKTVYETLHALWQQTADGFVIPKPIAYFDDTNTSWQAAWPGQDYTDIIRAGDWESYLPDIAKRLAALHQQQLDGLAKNDEVSLTAVLENAHDQEEDVNDFFDAPRPELRQIVADLEARYPALAAQAVPQTLVHGTFKISQIMVNGDEIALVDFDSVTVGDPWYDVAEFISSLVTLEAKHDIPAAKIVAGIKTFLNTYTAEVSWPCDLERIRWYATAFIAARLHSLLKGLKIQTEAEFVAALDCLHTLLPLALT